ncbi:MAG: DUF4856 domain-containing protein [Crocinitomicaceae bacterium]|nr:DUF4856 domain-containing protein [Crocinitomicaceae bacterium]
MKNINIKVIAVAFLALASVTSCKKKGCTDPTAYNYSSEAKKDDGSCSYDAPYTIPTTYDFTDANGNNTVSYSGQTDRLNQLREMVVLMKSATTTIVYPEDLKAMFANTGGNGNGNFSFTSPKQLKDKCFSVDQALFETWMDRIALASVSFGSQAADGQAGVLTSGTSTYLFDENGKEYLQFIEKGLMGAVFMNQALNVYFVEEINVDNTTAVDAVNGKYYTEMEHHFDEAFGYFGVDIDFPTTIPTDFWGKYCNSQNATLNSNADMINNFRKGRAAISNKYITDRDKAITAISKEWEEISAFQAKKYLQDAIGFFGNDDAKYLHALSEAYAFSWNLRYAPEATRRFTPTSHTILMNLYKSNFWEMTIADLNAIISEIDAKY